MNRSLRFLALLSAALIIGLSACKKTYDDVPKVITTTALNVVNASTDTVNLYLNGTRLNNSSSIYPGVSSGYYPVPFGQQTYQVKKMFNPVTSVVQTLFSTTSPNDEYYYHSLFVTDETTGDAFFTTDALAGDTVSNDTTCYVRFVNASPDAGSLDFAVGDTVKFTGQAFKTAGGFTLVGISGVKPINVYHTGSTVPILSLKHNIGARQTYTFYARGKLNGTGTNAFSIGTSVNIP
jgi:hypothetical protein